MNKIGWAALGVAVMALLVALYGLYENRQIQRNFQMLALQKQAVKSDGKTEDPYLAKQVKNSIVKSFKDLQECYNLYLTTKPQKTAGVVQLDWQITEDGRVQNPGVIRDDFQDAKFGNCLAEQIGAIRFPPPPFGLPKYVEHSFAFKEEEAKTKDEVTKPGS